MIDFSKLKPKQEEKKDSRSWWEKTKEASIAQAKKDKEKGFTGILGDSAKQIGKALVTPVIKGGTYGQNILSTGEDILGGKYFGTEIPSMLESAEKRRQATKEQETKAFNIFDFSNIERGIASTTTDLAASLVGGAGIAKGLTSIAPKVGGLFTMPKTVMGGIGQGAVTGGASEVPYRVLTEGRLPTAGEIGTSATVGGTVGSVIGAIPKIQKYSTAINLGGYKGLEKSVSRDIGSIGKIDAVKIDKDTLGKIRQAVRPSVTGIDTVSKFDKQDKKLLQGVKEVVRSGESPKTTKQAMESVQKTKQKLWEQVQSQNKAVTKETTGSEIADELRKALKDKDNSAMFRANPQAETAILKYIEDIQSNPRWAKQSQDELQNTLTTINESLPSGSFMKQLDANPTETIKNTLVSRVLRSKIDDNLEEAIGASSQELRNAYGSVRQLEKDLAKRYGVYLRQNPQGLADIVGMDAFPEIIAGVIRGDIGGVAKGIGIKAAKMFIKSKNNPDNIIKDIFKMQSKLKPGERIPTKINFSQNKPIIKKPLLLGPATGKTQSAKVSNVQPIKAQLTTKQIIEESKKELKGAVRKTTHDEVKPPIFKRTETQGPTKISDIIKGSRREQLYKDFESRQNKLMDLQMQKEMKGENLSGYPDSLFSAMKKIKSVENRTMRQGKLDEYSNIELLANKNPTFRKFVDEAKAYIDETGSDKSVQEIFDEIILVTPKPAIIKSPALKALDLSKNKKGFISPKAIGESVGLVKKGESITMKNKAGNTVQLNSVNKGGIELAKKSGYILQQKSPGFNKSKPFGLTTEEGDLISKYSNWGYKLGSNSLSIDRAIEKIPNSPGLTFRGDNVKDFSKFEKGKTVSFGKPLSTSYKSDIADNFKGNTVFTIDGVTGKDISILSDVSGEGEILFNSKSKFKVKSVYKSMDGITNIELSQVE